MVTLRKTRIWWADKHYPQSALTPLLRTRMPLSWFEAKAATMRAPTTYERLKFTRALSPLCYDTLLARTDGGAGRANDEAGARVEATLTTKRVRKQGAGRCHAMHN